MTPVFNFSTDIAQLVNEYAAAVAGKTILVTGITPNSIGSAFVNGIVSANPKLVILAGRTKGKADETAAQIHKLAPSVPTRFLELDLVDQTQVRQAAHEVNSYVETIDVLMLNAGVMSTPWGKTPQGIELQFGINHIGHFLFTNLILPKVLASPAPRIVLTSSDGYRLGPVRFYDHNFDDGKVYNSWYAYGESKTANLLYARSLAAKLSRKHPSLRVYSHHPGVVGSNLMQHMQEGDFEKLIAMDRAQGWSMYWAADFPAGLIKTPGQGAATMFVAAFAGEEAGLTPESNGKYLVDCHVPDDSKVHCWGRDDVDAERLWALSEQLVGQAFAF